MFKLVNIGIKVVDSYRLFATYFRFELDMLLESVSSTFKRAEELLNNISESLHNMETPFHVENYFTGLYFGVNCSLNSWI